MGQRMKQDKTFAGHASVSPIGEALNYPIRRYRSRIAERPIEITASWNVGPAIMGLMVTGRRA